MNKKMPEQDEFVIATVKKIFPYGAFCSLDEYDGAEAFIHVSEVAPRWIKNIHEFLKEGQKIVAKVHRFVPEKNLIDISLKRVTEADKKRILERHQRKKRAIKLLELTARKAGKKPEEAESVYYALEQAFGEAYGGLEELSFNTSEALQKISLPEEWKTILAETAQSNIKKQKMQVSAVFVLENFTANGVESVKKSLFGLKGFEKNGAEIRAAYLGAPRYKVAVTAFDYKTAEAVLEKAFEHASEVLKKEGGKATLKRE